MYMFVCYLSEFRKKMGICIQLNTRSVFDSTVKWKFYLTFIDRPTRMATNTYLTYVPQNNIFVQSNFSG